MTFSVFERNAAACMLFALVCAVVATSTHAGEPETVVEESFDMDPGWDGFRNRLLPGKPPTVKQQFGYRKSNHAGGGRGEIGGSIQRAFEPAYYAAAIPAKTLDDKLTASGKFAVTRAEASSGVMFGWFNNNSRGWRTPNSLAMRIDGNGGKYWLFYEYGTQNWRTGGGGAFEGERYQTTPTKPFPADGTVHQWSLVYDPKGNAGAGMLTFSVDGKTWAPVLLRPGHKQDGAVFDRFGLFNVQIAGEAMDVFFDDIVVNGERITFDEDPGWDGRGNDVEYEQRVLRPFHDFGYSPTSHAGGRQGEIGGIIFRDEKPAYYGGPTGRLTLDDELYAAGKIAFLAAGSDSGVSIGWFNAGDKQNKLTPEHEQRQANDLAVTIEGPSRVGHYFRPSYSNSAGEGSAPTEDPITGRERAIIRPDGEVQEWSLHYRPHEADGRGRITLRLDGDEHQLDLAAGHRARGATFDRFGIFNIQSGGHHVQIYVDDLRFTAGGRDED